MRMRASSLGGGKWSLTMSSLMKPWLYSQSETQKGQRLNRELKIKQSRRLSNGSGSIVFINANTHDQISRLIMQAIS